MQIQKTRCLSKVQIDSAGISQGKAPKLANSEQDISVTLGGDRVEMFVLVSKSTLDNLIGYSFSDHISLMGKSSELIGPRGNQSWSVQGQGLWLGLVFPNRGSCTTDST